MIEAPQLLLVGAVIAVGVLHTMVPDHWLPIALIARERGWSRTETAAAALQAGTGHVASTLLIGLAAWLAGVAVAQRFGQMINTASAIALVGLGAWVALSAWRELRAEATHSHHHDYGARHQHPHDHAHDRTLYPASTPTALEDDRLYTPLRGDPALLTRHIHIHRHGRGLPHIHWHDHLPATAHPVLAGFAAEPPLHIHRHRMAARTTLLLILGSSPMIEGLPAFFAAAKYGPGLLATMAIAFALSTIAAYVALCVYTRVGLQRLRLGPVERYGEVLSGVLIAIIGVLFGLWPAL